MKKHFVIIFLVCVFMKNWAAGSAESGGSATRGKYLAGQGIIIPAEEIYIDSYIAQIDYRYPKPEDSVGLYLYSGHRQLSKFGQEEVFHIGIQAKEIQFNELPPMNLSFVIDKSGSMSDKNKMGWVKESFEIFIKKVRDIDYISLIVFDSNAKVVFKSTLMNSSQKRQKFLNSVNELKPGGGTNLIAGLELGYKEVLTYFQNDYSNRLLFLTDGVGDSRGILDMAKTYKGMGINISTIGLGSEFDHKLMRNLAITGGGSSRFISDREEMEKTFSHELDRMVVPAARDLKMKFELLCDGQIIDTWGYNHRKKSKSVDYYLATLYHRDYETIVVKAKIHAREKIENNNIAQFSLSYKDLSGKEILIGPQKISARIADLKVPVAGISNAMVLKSATMMSFAEKLKSIGNIYYDSRKNIKKINVIKRELWNNNRELDYKTLSSPESGELENDLQKKLKMAFDLTLNIKKQVYNTRMRLDNEEFDDELKILDDYLAILGKDLEYNDSVIKDSLKNVEITPKNEKQTMADYISAFFNEVTLDLNLKDQGILAIAGFTSKKHLSDSILKYNLLDLLNEYAILHLSRLNNITIVERTKFDLVLKEQSLGLTDLLDIDTAVEIGSLLAAQYLLTGTVVEMPSSVVIFGRIVNVETIEVESVAQVIITKDELFKKG